MGRGPDTKPRVRRTKEEIQGLKSKPEEQIKPITQNDSFVIRSFPKNNHSSTLFDERKDKIIQTFNNKTKDIFLETNAINVFKFYKDSYETLNKFNSAIAQKRYFKEDHDGFRGGSNQQIIDCLENKFDQTKFLQSKENLKNTIKNLSFLEEEISRKRVRKMSEHDGELDFDRIWDRNQFFSTEQKNKGIERTLDINVDFSFNCDINQKHINEYGCLVWSIIDLLESNGINCSINITTKTLVSVSKNKNDASVDKVNTQYIKIKLKEKGEYIETIELAKCFTSNFYRRAMFNLYGAQLDAIGVDVPFGLGESMEVPAFSEKGKINFAISHMSIFKNDHEQLKEFIRNAI